MCGSVVSPRWWRWVPMTWPSRLGSIRGAAWPAFWRLIVPHCCTHPVKSVFLHFAASPGEGLPSSPSSGRVALPSWRAYLLKANPTSILEWPSGSATNRGA